jgi:spermidine/putrescine transport system substrate-binding protein
MRTCVLLLLLAASAFYGQELRVTVYDGYAPPELTAGFRAWAKEKLGVDVNVVVSIVGNNEEAYNAIRTGVTDVCVATSNMLGSERYKLISGKLVQPLDVTNLLHYPEVMPSLQRPDFLLSDGKLYGVTMNYGPLGLAYNATSIPTAPTSWKVLVQSGSTFAVSKDWPEANVAVAGLIAGVPKNQVFDFGAVNTPAVKAVLSTMAKQSARKWKGVDDVDSLLGLQYATAWGFAFADLAKRGESWAFAEPVEGTLGFIDSFVLPSSLKPELKNLAMAYIDYSISPTAQAILAKGCGGMSVNPKAKALLTAAEAKSAKLDDPTWVTDRCIMLKPLSLRDFNGITRLWEEAQK